MIRVGTQALAGQLIRARAQRGWTQAELADKAGLAVASVGRAEAGKAVSHSTWSALASALGGRIHIVTELVFD